jgi:acyl-homoserine lactone acylase PvdQ
MKHINTKSAFTLVLGLLAAFAYAEPRQATIYRDTWGVPHIYADTWPEAAYALGYAQAEDRLEDIYKNIRTAIGTMAEAFGEEYVDQDYILRLFKNADVMEEYWKTAPDYLREIADSFMRGVDAYVAEHPEKKPEFALDLYGWQGAAVGRAMILQWPLGVLKDEVDKKKEAPAFGSNAFAVAPSRSAEGCAILMTDPHLTWEGMAVFYEARLHTKEEDLCGYFLVGSPAPALAHNANVAWACTTGGPDTSDVYMVKLNPQNFTQYEYNGTWRTFEAKSITINVKDKTPQVKPALYSLYGPLVDMPDTNRGIAYCGATPYYDQTSLFEQMYKMAKARNCDEFYEALAMNQFMEQNVLFADRDGNVQYVRTGRTPIRPEGYDWSVPVPGGTDATRWLGIHDIRDLVQMKNPPQGYFQNCNVSPAVMMRDSPLTPDKYAKYIYNVLWDKNSPRGRRLLELLDADKSVTKEEAIAYMTDVYDLRAKPWQTALKVAADEVGAHKLTDPALAKAVKDILEWDGRYLKDSTAALIFKFWRLKCQDAINIVTIADGNKLTIEDEMKMLDLLSETLADIKGKYGSLDVKWGDVNLIGRDGHFFPLESGSFGGGKDKKNETETVFNASVREIPGTPGKYAAYKGSGTLMISFLHKDGIESYSVVAWGESSDPNSPHHVDQSEKLYTHRQLKPTWFKKEDLLKNVESEKVIAIP